MVQTQKENLFLNHLKKWKKSLKTITLKKLINQSKSPKNITLISEDMVKGFCYKGPLASQRIVKIISPIVRLLKKCHSNKIKKIILMQDSHEYNSEEFDSFPPHCVIGTIEAETIDEIKNLPFSNTFKIIPKPTINSFWKTPLNKMLDKNKSLKTIISVGNCTDFCLYQLALGLKLRSIAKKLDYQIIVPANCVDTYDISVKTAKKLNILPHLGDLFHLVFLYHLHLNGIKIVKEII